MTQVCPLPILPANPRSADYHYFIRQFDNYLVIATVQEAARLPLLMNALGRDGIAIFDGLADPKDTLAAAKARLSEYFSGKSSILLRRKQFFEARQQSMESIPEYVCRLRRLAKDCAFTDCATMLRDIFVIGVSNDRLGENLLTEDASTLTFDTAVAKAETIERALRDRGRVQTVAASQTQFEVCRLNPSHQIHGKNYGHSSNISCYRCGSLSHKANSPSCTAINAICSHCHKKGHLQRVCKAKVQGDQKLRYGKVRTTKVDCNAVGHNYNSTVASNPHSTDKQPSQHPSYQQFSVFSIGASEQNYRVLINGKELLCVVDTGTQLNIIPRHLIDKVDLTSTDVTLIHTEAPNFMY